MEKTYNPALIQRTQRYMETHSISQNQFAAKVNLSSAALSSYLNQKYKGSVEAVERQLSEFFKLDEEAEAAAEKTASLLPRAAYVPTSISEDVCQSIRFAQLEHTLIPKNRCLTPPFVWRATTNSIRIKPTPQQVRKPCCAESAKSARHLQKCRFQK